MTFTYIIWLFLVPCGVFGQFLLPLPSFPPVVQATPIQPVYTVPQLTLPQPSTQVIPTAPNQINPTQQSSVLQGSFPESLFQQPSIQQLSSLPGLENFSQLYRYHNYNGGYAHTTNTGGAAGTVSGVGYNAGLTGSGYNTGTTGNAFSSGSEYRNDISSLNSNTFDGNGRNYATTYNTGGAAGTVHHTTINIGQTGTGYNTGVSGHYGSGMDVFNAFNTLDYNGPLGNSGIGTGTTNPATSRWNPGYNDNYNRYNDFNIYSDYNSPNNYNRYNSFNDNTYSNYNGYNGNYFNGYSNGYNNYNGMNDFNNFYRSNSNGYFL